MNGHILDNFEDLSSWSAIPSGQEPPNLGCVALAQCALRPGLGSVEGQVADRATDPGGEERAQTELRHPDAEQEWDNRRIGGCLAAQGQGDAAPLGGLDDLLGHP